MEARERAPSLEELHLFHPGQLLLCRNRLRKRKEIINLNFDMYSLNFKILATNTYFQKHCVSQMQHVLALPVSMV